MALIISPVFPTYNRGQAGAASKTKSPVEVKAEKVVQRCLVGDLALGIVKSKFFRATVFSGLAVGALFLTFHLLALSPPSWWMITATAGGGLAIAMLAQLPFFKGKQKLEFEVSALSRLFTNNYNEITTSNEAKIFLGALPNRLRSEGERLANKEQIEAVFSMNEDWERSPLGLSLPYTKQDWNDLDIAYGELIVRDHTLLNDKALHEAADFIHNRLQEGKNVYVHCRAGCGRSAMGIAAYLIKYGGKPANEACKIIKTGRPVSTIWNKLERLKEFERNRTAKQ